MASHLEIFNAFFSNGKEYNIRVVQKEGEPLFRADDIGEVLEMVNVRASIVNFDDDERVMVRVHPQGEGGSYTRDVTFLTEIGLYRLVMQSRKPIARPFQKWVAGVVKAIREKGRYDLQQAREEAERKTMELLEQQVETKRAASAARHDALVNAFEKGRCLVYFGRIRESGDGRVLVKIGSTKDLHDRAANLIKEFGGMEIFEIFPVAMYRQFEDFLQGHPHITPLTYKEVIHEGRRSNKEVFLMTEDEIGVAVKLAKRHAPAFNDMATTEQIVQLEVTRLKNAMLEKQSTEIVDTRGNSIAYYIAPAERRYTQARGDKVQRYSSNGKALLATYNGLADAARDKDVDSPVAPLIKQAALKRTLYKGFRWAMLDRGLSNDSLQDIGETIDSRTNRKGLIAMINLDRTCIVKVFSDMKEAAKDRHHKGLAGICKAVKNGTQSGGHYFKMWFDCSQDLKDSYLEDATLPEPTIRSNSLVVEQIHPVTKEVVKRYSSITHIQTQMRVSRANLKRAIDERSIVKGYFWRMAEE